MHKNNGLLVIINILMEKLFNKSNLWWGPKWMFLINLNYQLNIFNHYKPFLLNSSQPINGLIVSQSNKLEINPCVVHVGHLQLFKYLLIESVFNLIKHFKQEYLLKIFLHVVEMIVEEDVMEDILQQLGHGLKL